MRGRDFSFIVVGSFLLERIFSLLTPYPVLIFVPFCIMLLLCSKNLNQDLPRVILVGILFDLFSGFTFGLFSLILLGLVLSIYLLKKQSSVGSGPVIFLALFTLFFSAGYALFLSWFLLGSFEWRLLTAALVSSAIFFMPIWLILSKLPQHDFSRTL